MKKVRLSYLRLAGLAFLLGFVLFASISSEIGEWYAIFIYPWISKILSAVSSLVGFSLDEWAIVCVIFCLLIVPFYWKLSKHKKWSRIVVGELEILLWVYVWFYWAWGMNYDRYDFYHRAEVTPASYNEKCFHEFLEDYTNRLKRAFYDCQKEGWMESPDLFRPMAEVDEVLGVRRSFQKSLRYSSLNDSSVMRCCKDFDRSFVHEQIKAMYRKIPERYGLCVPQTYQQPKRSSFNGLYSSVGVLGFMGPFFTESHVNLDLTVLEYPFTYAHELSHLLGVSSEAEANFWAYVVCVQSSHPLIRLSGFVGLLSYVRSNAYWLLSPIQFQEWESSLPSEVLAALYRVHAYWALRYNPLLGELQSVIYEFYLKQNKIASGQKNYAQVIGMLLSLADFGICLE